jgi:phosphohistidine phosphatase
MRDRHCGSLFTGVSIDAAMAPGGLGEETTMRLYFVRHGDATWDAWTGPDEERPLTKKGRKQLAAVAASLQALNVRPHLILTSPLPRAAESAQILADTLGGESAPTPALSPGFGMDTLKELVQSGGEGDLLLVGHEPDFSQVIGALTGGSVRLAKAGVARVDLEQANDLHGRLVWLVPPKVMSVR